MAELVGLPTNSGGAKRLNLSMTKLNVIVCISIFACSIESFAAERQLTEKMLALDTALFNSFNKCEDELELSKHASYFDPNVEFYHDNGGVTWDRKKMIENTEKYACGNFTRELIPETFEAYPIEGFGAITKGVHRFCQSESNACEGKAEFVMVWQYQDEKWRVTRTLSFGHRPNH